MLKRIISINIILLFSINVLSSTWETIEDKTWLGKRDFPTEQYVFYETVNGLKKAIYQINGSGRCAVLLLIYDVELKGDTIYLKNELNLEDTTEKKKNVNTPKILYLKNDSIIIEKKSQIEYHKAFNNAYICNWIETYSGYQVIPIEIIKAIPLEENQIYDIHSFNLAPNLTNCGIDNDPELSDEEANFLNEYLRIPSQMQDFDFHNKKILFVTGSSGNTIGSKTAYFNSVREWKEKYNSKIATSLIVLDEDEKKEYGYDAIVTYWVKVYNINRKKVLKLAKYK